MRQIFIILLAVASFATMGQSGGSYLCGNNQRKSLEEIKGQFPFNQTTTIKVVSYKGYDSIPKTRGRIDFEKMFEVKILNDSLKEEVFDLLANYENKSGIMEVAFCWTPKNGIVFLDKNGKVVTYIDICFSCQQYFTPQFKLFPFFCNEKMEAIKDLMRRAGITYGMRRHEPIEPRLDKPKPKGEDVFLVVDEPPEFPGGPEALSKFLASEVRYPSSDKKGKYAGVVYVQFIIQTDGSVSDAMIIKGINKDFDREAIRVVQSMPKWVPGKDSGEFVRVKFVFAVRFRVPEEK